MVSSLLNEKKLESTNVELGEIIVENVSRVYKSEGNEDITALENINLKIQSGKFISFIGASGCGKSTLLRLIAGLDKPDSGSLYIDGEEIQGPDYLRGLVFQNPNLFPWLTVKGNVSAGLKARNIGAKNSSEIDHYIKLIGLEGFEKSYPHQLSGGMAQRVALARVLVNSPKVILMDEPFGALDAFTKMNMQDEILKIWQERKTTMIMVTHDIDEAIYLSDQIVVMTPRPGRIQKIFNVEISRPRRRSDPDFFKLRSKILETLGLEKQEPLEFYL